MQFGILGHKVWQPLHPVCLKLDLTRGMEEMEKGQTPKKAGGRWALQTLMEWYQQPLQTKTLTCLLCIAQDCGGRG